MSLSTGSWPMGRSNETSKIDPSMKNEQRTGCPKSHCAKVWAYCSAFNHLRSAKSLRECSRKVAHSRNSMVLAKSMFIFLNERLCFTFFALLTCLDHIPFELLLFGPTAVVVLVKWCWLCTTQRHERKLYRWISRTVDILEL